MKRTRTIMGMPISIEIFDPSATENIFDRAFSYFRSIDEKFSTFKATSEITKINRGELDKKDWSDDMNVIFMLAEETKRGTDGFFDIKKPDGSYDPSGIVKGWAIYQAARILDAEGCEDYCVEAGGDIQVRRKDAAKEPWSIGIRDPFHLDQIVKVIAMHDGGVATSGTYLQGQHIYNPHRPKDEITEIVSLTVVGPNIYDADRFATAAFAMGSRGIAFIERLNGFEGYAVDNRGMATETSGFARRVKK